MCWDTKVKNILNYIKINDNISTAGQPSKTELEVISKNGFEVVINLALYNSDNALKNEDKIVNKNNMTYIHIPVSWEKPQKQKVELFISILKSLKNKKVFIHCAKNYRVSVFMYIYRHNVLKDDSKLILPNKYKLNKIWGKFIKKAIL